jgi:hypothetical protein
MGQISRRTVIRGLAVIASAAGAARAAVAEPAPLAIQGYDPVAYFTMGAAVPGVPALEHEWDEQRYRFARPEHRDLFKADPVRYAPQFGGFCAQALSRGEVLEANPQYWLVSDGRLYLFGKPVGPQLFQQDADNVRKAQQYEPLVKR